MSNQRQDIETTVEQSHFSIRPSCSAAFRVEIAGEERLVVVAEVERRYRNRQKQLPEQEYKGLERRLSQVELGFDNGVNQPLNTDEVVGKIRSSIAEQHELQVYGILLLKAGSIPKTSSGKIQRHACRTGFEAGTFDVMAQWIENSTGIANHCHEKHVEQQPKVDGSLQTWLISQISQRLHIKPQDIDIRKPLSYYGLDSVQAILFVADLEQYVKRKLSPGLLYDYPTIEILTQYLLANENNATLNTKVGAGRSSDIIDINAEAVLDLNICPKVVSFDKVSEPHAIFLTGATGFLGAFLLQEILQNTLEKLPVLITC